MGQAKNATALEQLCHVHDGASCPDEQQIGQLVGLARAEVALAAIPESTRTLILATIDDVWEASQWECLLPANGGWPRPDGRTWLGAWQKRRYWISELKRWLPTMTAPIEQDGVSGRTIRLDDKACNTLSAKEAAFCAATWGQSEKDLNDLVPKVWGNRYRQDQRAKIDTLLSRLNRKLQDADIPLTYHHRGDVILVDYR